MEFGQPPRIVRGRPPRCPRTKRRRRSTPRGSGGLFLSRVTSGTEDFLTEGGTYNTRRRPQRAGPCGKGRSGDPPRSRPRSVVPPPFCGSLGVLGLRYALPPPRLGRPVAWREVSPKGPNRRFDRRSYRLLTAGRRGGARATGRTPRAFSLQKSGTDPQKPEIIRGSG